MKGCVLQGKGQGAWQDVPVPEIGPYDALNRPTAVATCTTDIHLIRTLSLPAALGKMIGHEAAGTVEQVGDLVTDFQPGDRVLLPSIIPDYRHPSAQRGEAKYHQTNSPYMSNDPAVGGWFSELAKVFDSLALLASWAATAEQAGELTGSDAGDRAAGGGAQPDRDGHGLVVVQQQRRHGRAGAQPVTAVGSPAGVHRVPEVAQPPDVAPHGALGWLLASRQRGAMMVGYLTARRPGNLRAAGLPSSADASATAASSASSRSPSRPAGTAPRARDDPAARGRSQPCSHTSGLPRSACNFPASLHMCRTPCSRTSPALNHPASCRRARPRDLGEDVVEALRRTAVLKWLRGSADRLCLPRYPQRS